MFGVLSLGLFSFLVTVELFTLLNSSYLIIGRGYLFAHLNIYWLFFVIKLAIFNRYVLSLTFN
jgi:hypothetical protein